MLIFVLSTLVTVLFVVSTVDQFFQALNVFISYTNILYWSLYLNEIPGSVHCTGISRIRGNYRAFPFAACRILTVQHYKLTVLLIALCFTA